MKNLVITIAILLSVLTCRSQTYNSVPTELVHLRTSGGPAFLTLNKDASLIETKFGAPSSITSEYWEMNDITVKKYDYNGNLFYLHNNKLVAFELNNADFYVGQIDRAIRVGENVSSLSSWYPESYKGRDREAMIILVSFSSSDPMARSEYIAILFNESGIITKVDLVIE